MVEGGGDENISETIQDRDITAAVICGLLSVELSHCQ